jgi:hypothetical protein
MEAARALALGYLVTAPERALLRIVILDDGIFEQIRILLSTEF